MLFKIDKILCPLDFSDYSYRALQIACDLATDYKAKLLLLHVVPPVPVSVTKSDVMAASSTTLDIVAYEEAMQKNAYAELEALRKKIVPQKLKAELLVCIGQESDTIVEQANEQQVDCIVMMTHGRTGLTRLIMGSTAENVIRHAKQPVLSLRIKEDDEYHEMGHVTQA